MTIPPRREPHLVETPDQIAEIVARARQISDDLAWLYEQANAFSKPLWDTGWTQPIAGLLPLAESFAEWADKVEHLRPPNSQH